MMFFKNTKIAKAPDNEGLYVRNIFKSYQGKRVLEGIDLHLKRGETVALLGPNGAGKTTCFYMIAGLISIDQGDIFIDGVNCTRLPIHLRARAGLGYLPQEESIFRDLTVEDNIRAILEIIALKGPAKEKKLNELMDEFGIAHLRHTPSFKLSGGERQRLEIARALASNPRYLLLDEPLAGVDPISIGNISQIIKKLKSNSIGVLITDHNVRDTLQLVDRAYILNEGCILKEGTPREIMGDKKTRAVYLGDSFTY